MSRPVKRRCPQCGKVKLFRSDCKTCGCPRPNANPLAGRFWAASDETGASFAAGQILSRISSTLYLVRFYDFSAEGPMKWSDKIASVSSMRDWEISDEDSAAIWVALRAMEAEEQRERQGWSATSGHN
jgi:hypothetical protein